MKHLEKQLKALANRRRLAIIKFLKDTGESPVTDIAEHIKLSVRSTSKHIAILAAQDVLDREQRGVLVYYRLAEPQQLIIGKVISQI
ncbi:winged helix-turn-helix transcriptional regulator [Candidatus Uhrbacteria bacterium]|nr:winged helix-turn-helix transcriptional regulator [Candidatus Uhrbacteria bacterium]